MLYQILIVFLQLIRYNVAYSSHAHNEQNLLKYLTVFSMTGFDLFFSKICQALPHKGKESFQEDFEVTNPSTRDKSLPNLKDLFFIRYCLLESVGDIQKILE